MISIEMTGELPQLNADLEPAMQSIQDLMLRSVQLNILMGGRPEHFTMKNPHNVAPLFGSGRMYAGIQGMHDSNSATVYMDPNVKSAPSKNSAGGFFYPAALHFGAEVGPVAGKLMVFEYMGGTVFTMRRKGFKLGPFPFMIFQESDKTEILKILSSAIFSESTPI